MEAGTFSALEIVKANAKNVRHRREVAEAAEAEAKKAIAVEKALSKAAK